MNESSTADTVRRALGGINPEAQNILAYRYATDPMRRIWSPEGSVVIERSVQLAIMQAQADLGVDIPQEHIEDYRSVLGQVDLDAINEQERKTKHDVNARITNFNQLVGHQDVGVAMTSRDSTDQSEQYQKKLALEIVRNKTIAAIGAFASIAAEHIETPMMARTHNVPAQMTTLGKRLSISGEELLSGFSRLDDHLSGLKLRGIKGAVGTQQDILDLLEGDEEKVDELDQRIASELGFAGVYNSVGQIYPRGEDLETVQSLSAIVRPLSNFATGIRHMMGDGLVVESTKKRVGSNAMPHKINPRTSERIVGFYAILGGHETMLRPKAGEQWLEGDVSDSVIRRVVLPDSFYATDGALEAGLTVIKGFGIFEKAITNEIKANMPFLSTTKVLTGSIKKGAKREDMHEKIRDHSFNVVKAMKEKGQTTNDLLERLGADPEIPMTLEEIHEAINSPLELTGRAASQVQEFVSRAEKLLKESPSAAGYKEGDIL